MPKNIVSEWGSIREKGPVSFIIKYGVLGWGLCFGGLFWIFVRIVEPSIVVKDNFTLKLYAVSFASGLVLGIYLWFRLEHDFKKKRLAVPKDNIGGLAAQQGDAADAPRR
jgi:hypothetical protein